MRRVVLLAALALAAPAVLTQPAPGAAPVATTPTAKVTIADIEDEVMCPICGELLELAESPQAQREKVFVAHLIAEGKTKGEIKDALVAEYGPEVLALPEGSGFNLSAYVVPIVAFVLAAVALAAGAWRWRRRGDGDDAQGDPPAPPSGEDAERLDADIARYDL
jgi:cytochrome c-type biogenesis protein CcmH/NrfF